MNSIPKLDACFCGLFSLRCGALWLGYMNLLEAIGSIFRLIETAVSSEAQFNTAALIIGLIILVLYTLVAGFFLNGIYKNLPQHMLPYIAVSTLKICMLYLGVFFFIVSLPFTNIDIHEGWSQAAVKFYISLVIFLVTIIVTYSYLITLSYYRKVKDTMQSPENFHNI